MILEIYGSTDVLTLVLIVLYLPVFLIGVVGNASMVFIVATSRRLRSVTNLYLSNMAVADFAVCIVCIPMAVGQAVYSVWIYGEFMCKMTAFLQGVTVCASIFTIAVLSLDRLLAIRHPMIFKRVANYKIAAKMILVIWILSCGIMAPLIVFRKTQTLPISPNESLYFCHEDWPSLRDRQIYDSCLFVIVYVIPGVMIAISYGLIGRQLWTEDEDLKRSESEIGRGMSQKIMAGRKRVAKMLIALSVLFAVCWLPYYIVTLYLDFETHRTKDYLVVLPFTIFLGHANSALNPILYFYTSQSFRKYLIKWIQCNKYTQRQETPVNLVVNYPPQDGVLEKRISRRPIRKILTGSTCSSRSSSLRFSRSSNASLKSSNTSNYSLKRKENAKKEMIGLKEIPVIQLSNDDHHDNQLNGQIQNTKHRKAIMDFTLSIPTTIQEESSRSRASSPFQNPSIACIQEELSEKFDTAATVEDSAASDVDRLGAFV
ncbi:galanin receptor 2b [Patella vulgata]|uniref:galanin receptor 2b n=1 Tax=Patella vulgata TaxID=6465 RepID=UPI0021802F92|nr:galanin receptor 2b [Patella vulgata]